MKKILTFFFLIITFIYSNLVFKLILKKDPIYQQLNSIKNQYKIDAIEHIIEKDFLTIGKKGKTINLKKSYFNMKKINKFNESLIIYDLVNPKKKIKYNKYIKNSVDSFTLIIIADDNIENKIKLLKSNNISATIFVYDNNINQIKNIIKSNNDFGYIGSNKYKKFLLKIINKNYELVEKIDNNILEKCKKNKYYPIYPIIIDKKNLVDYKKYIKNGNIIALKNLSDEEIDIVINYIKSKNLNSITLNKLLNN